VRVLLGTYRVEWSAPALALGNPHKTRWFATDGDSVNLPGSSAKTGNSLGSCTISSGHGEFTLTQNTTFELQHQAGGTNADDGFGVATDVSEVEVYSIVELEKVA
jgi:hypothetical protein